MNLRNLTRQHDSLADMYVQTKLQLQAVLDQVFPEFRGVFGDLYSKERNPFKETAFSSHLISLELLINLLLQYQEHLANLDQSVDALAAELHENELIRSIPGIRTRIAATILAEVGEIDRFDHAKKLVVNKANSLESG